MRYAMTTVLAMSLMGAALAGCSPPDSPEASGTEATGASRPTTVLVTFLGLFAFADGPTVESTRALLVDARKQADVTDPTGCPIEIPRHEAFVAFAPPEGTTIVPTYVPWVLNGDDVTIEARRPEGAENRKPVPGTVAMETLGLEVDKKLLETKLSDQLVGRITFGGGRFVDTPHSGNWSLKKLDGTNGISIEQVRLGVTYRIDADSVTVKRGNTTVPLANGIWRVVISNHPLRPAVKCGEIDPRAVDVHFDWLYKLASAPPAASERRYPHFSQIRVPGDPCVGGDF